MICGEFHTNVMILQKLANTFLLNVGRCWFFRHAKILIKPKVTHAVDVDVSTEAVHVQY